MVPFWFAHTDDAPSRFIYHFVLTICVFPLNVPNVKSMEVSCQRQKDLTLHRVGTLRSASAACQQFIKGLLLHRKVTLL